MSQEVSEELLEAGRGYESLFVPALFEAWTKHLIDGAGVRDGSNVLDVACGTGVLARSALARTGAGGEAPSHAGQERDVRGTAARSGDVAHQ